MNDWRKVVTNGFWALTLGLLTSQSGEGQELDTFLVRTIKRSANDAPAYISAVNQRMAIQGDYVYVAGGDEGLTVYRLAGGSKAQLVGHYYTGGKVWTVRLRGNRLYVADQSPHGFTILDARNPMQLRAVNASDLSPDTIIQLRQNEPEEEPGGPKVVAAIVESRLYIARNDADVTVIPLHTSPDWPRSPVQPVQRSELTLFHADASPFVSRAPIAGTLPEPETPTQGIGSETSPMGPTPVANATKNLPVPAENPELRIFAENGLLRLHIAGRAGQKIRLQRSGDLTGPWTDWATEVLTQDEMDFTDSPGEMQSFYRAVVE